MKRSMLLLFAVAMTAAAMAQTKVADVSKFSSATIDLGKVKQGEPATASFEITNISQKPLVIEQPAPACGCIISDFTKTPLQPGEKGTVKSTLNAANTSSFHKIITVKFASIHEIQAISLNGDVVAPNKE